MQLALKQVVLALAGLAATGTAAAQMLLPDSWSKNKVESFQAAKPNQTTVRKGCATVYALNDEPVGDRQAVVLIHGRIPATDDNGSGFSYQVCREEIFAGMLHELSEAAAQDGREFARECYCLLATYDTSKPFDEIARDVRICLEAMPATTGTKQQFHIAHSYGTLVERALLNYEGYDRKVPEGSVHLLGGPGEGTPAAVDALSGPLVEKLHGKRARAMMARMMEVGNESNLLLYPSCDINAPDGWLPYRNSKLARLNRDDHCYGRYLLHAGHITDYHAGPGGNLYDLCRGTLGKFGIGRSGDRGLYSATGYITAQLGEQRPFRPLENDGLVPIGSALLAGYTHFYQHYRWEDMDHGQLFGDPRTAKVLWHSIKRLIAENSGDGAALIGKVQAPILPIVKGKVVANSVAAWECRGALQVEAEDGKVSTIRLPGMALSHPNLLVSGEVIACAHGTAPWIVVLHGNQTKVLVRGDLPTVLDGEQIVFRYEDSLLKANLSTGKVSLVLAQGAHLLSQPAIPVGNTLYLLTSTDHLYSLSVRRSAKSLGGAKLVTEGVLGVAVAEGLGRKVVLTLTGSGNSYKLSPVSLGAFSVEIETGARNAASGRWGQLEIKTALPDIAGAVVDAKRQVLYLYSSVDDGPIIKVVVPLTEEVVSEAWSGIADTMSRWSEEARNGEALSVPEGIELPPIELIDLGAGRDLCLVK